MLAKEPIGKIVHGFIDKDPTKSLNQISFELGYSPKYLSRVCHQQTGISFRKYKLAKTMELARDFLLNTEKRLYEISQQCGYSNVERFIGTFKKQNGTTPHQFRIEKGVKLPSKPNKQERLFQYKMLALNRYLNECRLNFKATKANISKHLPIHERQRFLSFLKNKNITLEE